MNRLRMRRNFRSAINAGQALDRRRRHIDREQQRPDLIMQVPREIGALFRLQRQQPFVQPAVLRCDRGELPGHEIEAVRQAYQLGRAMLRHLPDSLPGRPARMRRQILEWPQGASDNCIDQQCAQQCESGEHQHCVTRSPPDFADFVRRVSLQHNAAASIPCGHNRKAHERRGRRRSDAETTRNRLGRNEQLGVAIG